MNEMSLHPLRYIGTNLSIVIGIVLIWRGIWYLLDIADITFFGGSHVWTALAGIALGTLILYLPDRDLKELSNL